MGFKLDATSLTDMLILDDSFLSLEKENHLEVALLLTSSDEPVFELSTFGNDEYLDLDDSVIKLR